MSKGKHNAAVRRQAYAAGFEAGIAVDTQIWMEAIRRTPSITPEIATELAANVIRVAQERGGMVDGPEQPAATELE